MLILALVLHFHYAHCDISPLQVITKKNSDRSHLFSLPHTKFSVVQTNLKKKDPDVPFLIHFDIFSICLILNAIYSKQFQNMKLRQTRIDSIISLETRNLEKYLSVWYLKTHNQFPNFFLFQQNVIQKSVTESAVNNMRIRRWIYLFFSS